MLESMVGGEACDQNEYFDTTGHACDNSCNPMSVDLCLKVRNYYLVLKEVVSDEKKNESRARVH